MNPKEVSYSHPQLPLCDTPIFTQIRPFTGIETQKYGFFRKMQGPGLKFSLIKGALFCFYELKTAGSSALPPVLYFIHIRL